MAVVTCTDHIGSYLSIINCWVITGGVRHGGHLDPAQGVLHLSSYGRCAPAGDDCVLPVDVGVPLQYKRYGRRI